MSDGYHVTIMPRASDDIIRICEHIERDSPQNAATVAQVLLDAIDSLDQFPSRYKVHGSKRDPVHLVRSMPVPPIIVYYRVTEPRRLVQVLTVRHGHQRQPRSFA
jgi:plasmid stabilization system protein ParE